MIDRLQDIIIEVVGGGTDVAFTTVSYVLGAGVSVESLRSTNAVASTG